MLVIIIIITFISSVYWRCLSFCCFPSSPNSLTTELITFPPNLLRLPPYFYKWYQPLFSYLPNHQNSGLLWLCFPTSIQLPMCGVCLFGIEFILFFSSHSHPIPYWLLSGLLIHQRLIEHLLWLVAKESARQDRLILSNNLPDQC